MKKLLKISAMVLTMSALLFSCANPSGESSNSGSSSSIGANLPTITEVSKPTEVKPEDFSNVSNTPLFTVTKAVKSNDDFNNVANTLFSHLEDTFYYAGINLSNNNNFKTDILAKVINENGEMVPNFNIDATGKKYKAKGVALDIKTGKLLLESTETSGKIITEIAGSAVLDGEINQVRKFNENVPILDSNGNPIMEPNSIKYLVANLNTNAAVAATETVAAGDISAALSSLAAFDNVNGYSGYISLNGTVNIKDLETLSNIISRNEAAQKIINYNNTEGAPEPTEADYNEFKNLLDSYDKANINIKAQFLDETGTATGIKTEFTKLSQLYGLY